jgi:selenocysteine lyase/cysteine desulfurase
LYVRKDLLERLDVPKVEPAGDVAPDRLETGTLSHEAIVGAAAAVDYLASLAPGCGNRREALDRTMAVLHARGHRQVTRLWEGLRGIPTVSVYGPPPTRPRTSTVSFVVKGTDSTSVARHCAGRGLFVSNGDFYALTVARRFGHAADGLVRLGCAAYTSDAEVERAIAAIAEIA